MLPRHAVSDMIRRITVPPINDLDIIRRVLDGRPEAYAELVRAHQGAIRQLCAAILSDPHEAEDAAQEVFLKAYQSLRRFRGDASFLTWLRRIAVNHCRDLLRARARHRTDSLDALIEQAGDRIRQLIVTPPDRLHTRDESQLLDRLLAGLAPDYRLVLVLREIQGLSYEEIARALHCSLDSVKARLRRARRELEELARHFLKPGDV